MTACPDTGAMVNIAGPELMHKLGLSYHSLRQTKQKIKSVNGKFLNVKGYVLCKIAVATVEGTICDLLDIVYIVEDAPAMFICLSACKKLNIVSQSFPYPVMKNTCANTTQATTVAAPVRAGPQSGVPRTPSPAGPQSGVPRTQPPARPHSLPYPPTPQNVDSLKQWLLNAFATSAFNVNAYPLPAMSGPPMKIHLKPDATPHVVHTPIPIPHHWKAQVKADLDRDVAMGIIEPVPVGTPTNWCARMVTIAKRSGKPRRTIDFQGLNKQCLRETHHTPSPFNLAQSIPSGTYKTVLDAWNGYHAIALDEASKDLTQFVTEFGRYRYCRAPQGYLAAGDAYTRRYDEVTRDVPRKTKCVDDTLLWDKSIEENFWHTFDYLTLCARNGITFNPEKFIFAQREAEFAGLMVTDHHIKPTDRMLAAIREFPTPKDLSSARAWFGLCEQVAWAFAIKPEMQPFRDLVKPSTPFYWDDNLERAFQASREHIISLVKDGVEKFEIDRPTCLATDYSKTGIGFCLLQKYCSCAIQSAPVCCKSGWRLGFAGARFTTPAEENYVAIEGEMLSVVEGLHKCKMFVLGCSQLILAVDHRPLVGLLNDKPLEAIDNPRLFRLKEKTLSYRFTAQYSAGKWHRAPDCMSRYPVERPTPTNSENDMLAAAISSLTTDTSAITWEELSSHCANDTAYMQLIQTVKDGFSTPKQTLPDHLLPYWNVRDHLTILDNVCLFKTRPVIPTSLRARVMDGLHAAHQGMAGMKSRARISVYWPGMNKSLRNYLETCHYCRIHLPSQVKEPYIETSQSQWPYDKIVADYFDRKGKAYLAVADRFSGNIHVFRCPSGNPCTSHLITVFRELFQQYGVPQELATDGGSTFTSHEFQKFLQNWGVHHRLSSSFYPQSNGRAELAVKTAKRIIADCSHPSGTLNTDAASRALMQYRNTPLAVIGKSPAQLLFGRVLRDHIPCHPLQYQAHPEWLMTPTDRQNQTARRDASIKVRYNASSKPLPPIPVGTRVCIQNQGSNHPLLWTREGVVIETLPFRQYKLVMDDTQNTTIRNRKFIRPLHTVSEEGEERGGR